MTTVAIIGSSGHAGFGFDGLRECPNTVLAAIAPGSPDEDIAALARRCEEGGLKVKHHDDYLRMLDTVKPDIAVVNPWFGRTADVSCACLARGIHVFSEKPLAVDRCRLERLRDAYERSGCHLAAMHSYRYDSAFLAAAAAVDEGLIGEPLLLSARKSYKLSERPAFFRQRATYGGTIPWVGAHAIDWFLWFAGDRFATVSAFQTTAGNRGHDALEAAASVLFSLHGGGQASATIDFLRPAAAASHGDDRLRVAGDKGVVEVMHGRAILITQDESEFELERPPAGTMFADFIRQVHGKGRCRVTAADSFRVTELCLAARDSADTGGRVITL